MKNILLTLPAVMLLSAGSLLAQEETAPMMGMRHEQWGATHQKWHQEMVERWKDQDAKLDQLLNQAKSATGDQKVTALEALVSEMVTQRKDMHERMTKMHERMMEFWKQKTGTSGTATPSHTP